MCVSVYALLMGSRLELRGAPFGVNHGFKSTAAVKKRNPFRCHKLRQLPKVEQTNMPCIFPDLLKALDQCKIKLVCNRSASWGVPPKGPRPDESL